ncbi:polysaccharide biosynthesis tyrosine autokinase [Brevibacterium yomogidense]|uniref:polysaccharide biosynthesis tyrosine autokinase n=1 Tax=Brevibacterium yomogidense TaxID=946573 RepID=UPI0022B75EC2|nr:polysaccharide biosynthesis tyrosine autokinase [Brevibacterium yomogidense]
MTVSDFLRMTIRHAILIAACAIVGAIVAFGIALTRPQVFQASALGYVVTANSAGDVTGINNINTQSVSQAESYIPLFSTQAVAEGVAERTDSDDSAGAIVGSLSATVDPNLPIITVTAQADTADKAQQRANAAVEAVAEEAIKMNNGGELTDNPPVRLEPYQTAGLPGAPVAPNFSMFIMSGAGIGLLLGYSVAYYRFRIDTRIRTTRDLEAITDHPNLAVLPSAPAVKREDGLMDEPDDFAAREALRKLRTNLRYVNVDSPPRAIVITSSFQGEGKSTIAGNLARVVAESGQRVVLVDADLRRPTVHHSFKVDGTVGLTQAVAGSVDLSQVITATPVEGLFVIPAGQLPPNPSELLGSRKMKDVIERLSAEALVIIDAPPLLPVTDAVLLSVHTDGAIVVVHAGETTQEHLTRAIGNLDKVGSPVLGTVLNKASTKAIGRLVYGDAEYGYGYGKYQKGYYYGDDKKTRMKASKTGSVGEITQPAVRPVPAYRSPGIPASSDTPHNEPPTGAVPVVAATPHNRHVSAATAAPTSTAAAAAAPPSSRREARARQGRKK